MALSEVKISPQDDLVAALAATPKKGTLVLAKGVYKTLLLSITDDAEEAISSILSFTEQ